MKIIIVFLASLLCMTNAVQIEQSVEVEKRHHTCKWILRKAKRILNHMDTNKSGKVSFDEYYAYKLKFHYRRLWWRWAHKTKKYWSKSFVKTYKIEFKRWNDRNKII